MQAEPESENLVSVRTAQTVAEMMFELVIGGAASGKSEYAEQVAVEMAARVEASDLVYIATMAAADGESLRRIENHRRRRSGKGFRTIEKSKDLSAIDDIGGAVVLLEDLSNLAANELFIYEDGSFSEKTPELALKTIIYEIDHLIEKSACLIAVTNDIFEDGGTLEGSMLSYTKLLGEINVAAALRADRVTELVCGIPISGEGIYPTEGAGITVKPVFFDDSRTDDNLIVDLDCAIYDRHVDKSLTDFSVESLHKNLVFFRDAERLNRLAAVGCARDNSSCSNDEKEMHPLKIILVVGGYCQGKTAFAGSIISALKMSDTRHVLFVDDFHNSIRQAMMQKMPKDCLCGRETAYDLLKRLREQDISTAIVISALPCSGPVPIDRFERSWRDEVGKACQVIAMYSSEVYRVVCGIPQRLK